MGTAIREWTHKLLRLVNVKGRTTSLCVLGSAGMSGVVKKQFGTRWTALLLYTIRCGRTHC